MLDTAKGFGFIAVTATLLLGLMRRLERTDRKLREEEERWRLALDASGDGVWDWRARTNQVYYSPRLAAMLGYQTAEFGSDSNAWSERVHPDDAAGAMEAIERHLRGETAVYQHEHRLRSKNGSYRWILDCGVVIERDENGRPLRMVGTHSDITSRKDDEARRIELLDRLERIAQHVPGVIYQYRLRADGTSHFPYASDGIRQVFAVEPSAVAEDATPVFRVIHPDDLERVWDKIKESARSLSVWSETCRVILPSRVERWVEGHGAPQRLADGSTLWHSYIRDVTTERQVSLQAQENLEKFAAIFRSVNDAIFTADENYVITDVNERGLELFRAAREQIVGQRIVDFFPARQPDGSSSLIRAREILTRLWHERFPPFEWTHRRPDGSLFLSESTISSVSLHGRRSIIVVVRDLTERLKTTEQLRLLQAALQAAPMGLVITDATGRIEWVNPAFTRFTGYDQSEVIGGNPRLLRSGAHSPGFYRELWVTISRGEVWSGEIENRRRDGTHYHEHMTIAPVRAPDGVITHYVAIKEDISTKRELEMQLARAQRLESVGMLASGIAHDLNNVLTPILLSTELLKTTETHPQAVARLDLVAQAAQRGAKIVKQVLTFARGVEGERTAVQPRYLVKEMAQLASETFPREIEVRVECGEELPTVIGDITQLHQVLLNLAVNARDAMPRGGRLGFSARVVSVDEARARRTAPLVPGNYVELAVSDSGTGITEEVMNHLFEPFFTTKPRGKGTGLGLSTVYGIVRSHGGAVEIETKVGWGTTFRVLIPVPAHPLNGSSEPPPPPTVRGEGRLVLVVDDEEPIRIVAEQMLRRHGFKVVVASDGLEGLQLFRLRPADYHLAIVDMMMPRMNGAALMRELRKLSPALPMISSSGLMPLMEDERGPLNLAELGVSAVLPKPYEERELMAALCEALAGATSSGEREKKKV